MTIKNIRRCPAGLSPDETGRKLTHDLRKTPQGAGVAAAASIIPFEHRSLLNGTSVALVAGKHKPRGESRVTLRHASGGGVRRVAALSSTRARRSL